MNSVNITTQVSKDDNTSDITDNLWHDEGMFPPVGSVVKFWYDEYKKYMKGTVVYSGQKGATVDVGYLLTSGEFGDFLPWSKSDSHQEKITKSFLKCINQFPIPAQTASNLAAFLYQEVEKGKLYGISIEKFDQVKYNAK